MTPEELRAMAIYEAASVDHSACLLSCHHRRLIELARYAVALSVKLEEQEQLTMAQLNAHWFTQGGRAQFGGLEAVGNADEFIASILSLVRVKLEAAERGLDEQHFHLLKAVEASRGEVAQESSSVPPT